MFSVIRIEFVRDHGVIPLHCSPMLPFNARRREVETAKAQARRYQEDAERLQISVQRGANSERALAQAHIEKMDNMNKNFEKAKEELLKQREYEVASLAKQRQEANDMERRLRTKILVR